MSYLPSLFPADKNCVYKLFDRAGDLLYIGSTNNMERRREQHKANSPWYRYVAHGECIYLDTIEECRELEIQLIINLRPIYNVRRYKSSRGWEGGEYIPSPPNPPRVRNRDRSKRKRRNFRVY